jgi:hypothetical chaperone protein
VLDERMIVYTYASLDPRSVAEGFTDSEDYQVLLSRILYVDRFGADRIASGDQFESIAYGLALIGQSENLEDWTVRSA